MEVCGLGAATAVVSWATTPLAQPAVQLEKLPAAARGVQPVLVRLTQAAFWAL